MNGLQSLPQWQNAFNHPRSAMLGLLNAIQNIGALAGLPFAPYLADGMGRRVAVLLGAGIMVRLLPITFANHPITDLRPTVDIGRLSLPSSKPPPRALECSLAHVSSSALVLLSPKEAPQCWLPNCHTPPTVPL